MRAALPSLLLTVMMPLMVSADNDADSLSIGPRFHRETSFDDRGAVGRDLTFGPRLPLYKVYENSLTIEMPVPETSGVSIEDAISRRESIRDLGDRALSLAQLGRILVSGDGLTHRRFGHDMRAAPSGGALYPIDLYVAAFNVTDLENGLYHFQVADSSLELVKAGSFRDRLYDAAHEHRAVAGSPAAVILSSRFARSTAKYADRGYRYAYMEAGAIIQNIYLQCTALGLGTVIIGAFNDAALSRVLEVDGSTEAPMAIMPIGYPEP